MTAGAWIVVLASLAGAAADVTVESLGLTPTDKPAGRLLVAADKSFARVGEGSFLLGRDGGLTMFFDARRSAGDLDRSVIRCIRSADGGQTWSEAATVLADPNASILQPSLCRMTDGRAGMTYSRLLGRGQASKQFIASADDARTWTAPTGVSAGECGYMTGSHDRLICLPGGRLISLVHGKRSRAERVSYVFTSDDGGRTWLNRTPAGLTAPVNPTNKPEFGLWETSVVETAPKRLLLYGRTASGWVYASRSEDNGDTWSPAGPTSIANPLAPVRLTRVPGSDILLMFRCPLVDLDSGWHGGERRALTVQSSTDAGKTWTACRRIEFNADAKQWFDYPFLIWTDQTLHLAYRAPDRKSLTFSIYYQRLTKQTLLELSR